MILGLIYFCLIAISTRTLFLLSHGASVVGCCSVEHLSKWFKMLMIYDQDIPYQSTVSKLEAYINRAPFHNPQEDGDPVLNKAIAVIAYRADKHRKAPDKAANITALSLAATIESLRRAGFGRVVVVGLEDSDQSLVLRSFQLVADKLSIQQKQEFLPIPVSDVTAITQLGHMEVAFVQGSKEYARTTSVETNIPRSTLLGLKEAFMISQMSVHDQSPTQVRCELDWFGSRHGNFWQYVYLTEPDSILQTRPMTLQQLKAQVDQGSILVPHRLQPIPHESDVRGAPEKWSYLPEAAHFKEVLELDSLGDASSGRHADACCDEHKGPDWKPGRFPFHAKKCKNFWYMCDFHPSKYAALEMNGTSVVDNKYDVVNNGK